MSYLSASVLSEQLVPSYRKVYVQAESRYNVLSDDLEELSAKMNEWAGRWRKTTKWLSNPQAMPGLTTECLVSYQSEVVTAVQRMEAIKERVHQLSTELQKGVSYFSKAPHIYEPQIGDNYLRALGRLQKKRDKVRAIVAQMNDARAAGRKLFSDSSALKQRLGDEDRRLEDSFELIDVDETTKEEVSQDSKSSDAGVAGSDWVEIEASDWVEIEAEDNAEHRATNRISV